ncbi:MAG: helix-turn-helix transcriptional regulator [Cyanobacteria bacterium P01_A01_bin.135]
MTSTQVQQPPTLVAPSIQPSIPQGASTGQITIDYLALVFETCLDHIFPDQGLLLLDQVGKLIQSSPQARQLCGLPDSANHSQPKLPEQLSQLAQRLIESRELFPGRAIQLEDEVTINTATIHIEAKWIDLGRSPAYMVMTLEDLAEVTHQRALFDAYRYRFTPRETEVWELHLQGFSYRQIAEAFFISMNTVKRHMKSIYGKRREAIALSA